MQMMILPRFMLRLAMAFWLLAVVTPFAQAQSAAEISAQTEDDKGFITRFLQEKLSGAGRQVTIDGFEGALSSTATFTRMTITDDDGAWITLENGAIQWTRSALFAGRVSIQELSAERVILPRLPKGDASAPQAETREFKLPELPVGVNIEHINVGRVELGEPVIGVAATVSIDGSMRLSGGEGEAKLTINRVDGPRGQFALDANFSNETRILKFGLDLDEDANGLFVNLVNLEGRPSVKASIKGEGPLNQFKADLTLATNGQDRITGNLAIEPQNQDNLAGTGFRIQMGGDIAALVPPQHRDFFGTNSQLLAEGWISETGEMRVPTISVKTDALNLTGSVSTNEQGAPKTAQLLVLFGEDAQAPILPVRLPWADKPTTVQSGRLQLSYDATRDSSWTLKGRVGQISREELQLQELRLDGLGKVDLTNDALNSIHGWVAFGIDGLKPADAALARAVGDTLNGGLNFDFRPGNALQLSGVNVNGSSYGLKGDLAMDGLSSGITLSGDLTAAYRDLGDLSGLAGRELAGRGEAHIAGYYQILTRGFDADVHVTGTDIKVSQPQADRLLAGQSTIEISARRDETGIELRNLAVNAQNLTVKGQGYLNSNASDVTATIEMPSLAAADPGMSGAIRAEAKLSGPDKARKLTVNGKAVDLVTGVKQIDGALRGETDLSVMAAEQNGNFELEELTLANPQLKLDGAGSFATGAIQAKLNLAVANLAVLESGLSGGLNAVATVSEKDGIRLITVDGTGQELRLGQDSVDGALTGETKLNLAAEQQGDTFTIKSFTLNNQQMDATASGVYGPAKTDLRANLNLRSLASFGRGWRGAVTADASFADDGSGARRLTVSGQGENLSFGQAQVDGALAGTTQLNLNGTERDGVFTIDTATVTNPRLNVAANGKVGKGVTDITAELNAQDLRFLGHGFRGAVKANGHVLDQGGNRQITATGSANGLAIGNEKADALLRGQTSFDIAATMDAQNRLSFQRLNARNPQLQIEANGDSTSRLNVNGRLADVALVAPGFPGPAQVTGTIAETPQNFAVNLNATAPGNTRAKIEGTLARTFQTMDLRVNGTSDIGIVNPILRTRSVEGPLAIDLRINGKPSLEALSGRVSLRGGRLSDPKFGLAVSSLNATAELNAGRIAVDVQGAVENGGTITAKGPVTLTGDRPLNLEIGLNNVVLRDPNLYETRVRGQLTVGGSLVGGMVISGRLNVGETELRIPSTGFGGATSIPAIKHLYDRPPVRATRAKAGLAGYPSADAAAAGMNGPAATAGAKPARLDLVISAPRQVFVRGRGVDAELGGEIRVTGTSAQVIPVGQLELIRGRVDLLGKRFDMTEGLIELQGSMIPALRLVAETVQDGVTTRIIIDGEARDPEVKFESDPEMPQEEVISHLLFGRGLDSISALQAAQLANAIAVLAGKGGEGIVGALRNATGLDDLDLSTDDQGQVSVRAGKYLSKKLYTDVQVGQSGKTELNLNLDISRSLRARGTVDSEGDSKLGLYYERDY